MNHISHNLHPSPPGDDEAVAVENAIRAAVNTVMTVIRGAYSRRALEHQRMVADRDKEIRRLECKLEMSESELKALRVELSRKQPGDQLSCVKISAREVNCGGAVFVNQLKTEPDVTFCDVGAAAPTQISPKCPDTVEAFPHQQNALSKSGSWEGDIAAGDQPSGSIAVVVKEEPSDVEMLIKQEVCDGSVLDQQEVQCAAGYQRQGKPARKESLGQIREAEHRWIETQTPKKQKTVFTIEEDSHSDEEDETHQHQDIHTEENLYRTPKRPKTEYKNYIKQLEEMLQDQDKENRRLRRLNLKLQEDIVFKTVKYAIQTPLPALSHAVPSTSNHSALLFHQTGENKNESVSHQMNPTGLDFSLRSEGYKKLTRTLMDSIFTEEEMATCSVTGKKGIVGEKRQSLDQGKVKLVIDHVKKVHRGIGDTEIKACMAQKLKDTRRRAERQAWEPAGGEPED